MELSKGIVDNIILVSLGFSEEYERNTHVRPSFKKKLKGISNGGRRKQKTLELEGKGRKRGK